MKWDWNELFVEVFIYSQWWQLSVRTREMRRLSTDTSVIALPLEWHYCHGFQIWIVTLLLDRICPVVILQFKDTSRSLNICVRVSALSAIYIHTGWQRCIVITFALEFKHLLVERPDPCMLRRRSTPLQWRWKRCCSSWHVSTGREDAAHVNWNG